MNRQDEEKAKELSNEYSENAQDLMHVSVKAAKDLSIACAMELAKWKESQMIDRFMSFLHKECTDARLLHLKDEVIREKIEQHMNMEDDQ